MPEAPGLLGLHPVAPGEQTQNETVTQAQLGQGAGPAPRLLAGLRNGATKWTSLAVA